MLARLACAIVWEFRVRAGCEEEFERVYGARGAWAALFARSAEYLGSELLRDADGGRRYLTIDRWTSPGAFAAFHDAHAADYRALDASCERLTERETRLGTFSARAS